MRRLLIVPMIACLVAGCASEPAVVEGPRPLTTEAARQRLVEAMRAEGGGTLFQMPIEETTPDGVYEKLGVQTFRVRDEPGELYAYETFAVTDEEVTQVGSGLGGPGVTKFTMADADGDGRVDLLYVAGGGKRFKSFNAGAVDRPDFEPFDPAVPAAPAAPMTPRPLRKRDAALDYRDPIELRQAADGLDVWDPARDVRLGRLVMRADGADFVAADDLPPAVRRRFVSPPM